MRNEWLDSEYPMVTGHEIIGTVIAIGENVTKFKKGEKVVVGNLVLRKSKYFYIFVIFINYFLLFYLEEIKI